MMSTNFPLRKIVDAFCDRRVLVVGDVMLDEYIWGDVRRISPEAPVPVVNTVRRTYLPGGAGNVAANIAALEGIPLLGSVIGEDANGAQLIRVLSENGVRASDGLIRASDRPTTVKSRVVAHNQQMLRLDTEVCQPIAGSAENAILAWVKSVMTQADVCVLSDYAKGVLTETLCREIINLAKQHNVAVIVDPKGRDYRKYSGATVVTPNHSEARIATNRALHDSLDLDRVAGDLLDLLDGTSLLVTQGAAGITLYQSNHPPLHIPAQARNVFDVTGAGDTVVATLAMALATKAPLDQATFLANLAAGVVVGKFGTATLSRADLSSLVE